MSATTLPIDAVRFFSADAPAHRARLFEWSGDLYRAIRPGHTAFFESLRQSGAFTQLAHAGLLVRTEPTPLRIDGYGPVYRHPRAPFVTYPFEWPAHALRDAALAFLDLNLALAEHGAATCDAHAWNTVFFGHKPVFVDLGSLTPLASINGAAMLAEFEGSFLRPLALMADGQHRIARALMRDYTRPITDDEMGFLRGERGRPMHRFVRKVIHRVTPDRRVVTCDVAAWRRTLESMRRRVETVRLPSLKTTWGQYYDQFPSFDDSSQWTPKESAVAELLRRSNPATVHDVGSNRGWYAQFASHRGAAVIATDRDETALDRLYLDTKERRLNVTTAYMDMRDPAPAYGWNAAYFPASTQRFAADCTLGLAIVHHLVFRGMADFPLFLDSLATLTRRELIVEFISTADQFVSKWDTAGHPWYTLENFAEQAGCRFQHVEVSPSHPAGRYLLSCRSPRNVNTRLSEAA